MASRALGAFFALAAAAAIVVSIAASAWWAGTPVVNGKAIEAKYVHAGPLGAIGCNVGGDGSCDSVTVEQTVQLVGYGALGAAGLATLLLFILLSAALRVSDHRRGIATTSLFFTLLAGGAAGAMLAIGPGIEASQTVEVPIGWGAFVFGGGIFASLVASLITRTLEPEPLRLKPGQHAQQAPQQGTIDVRDVLREQQQDILRPSTPEMRGNGGPQLRPLYDPQGEGVVPPPHAPQLPMRAPTPLPREAIGQLIGQTPPPALTPPSQPPRNEPPSGPPRLAPSTPALSGRPSPFPTAGPSARPSPMPSGSASSPRIRPPNEGPGASSPRIRAPNEGPGASSPRIRSPNDAMPPVDDAVNPFARTRPAGEVPIGGSSPRIRPPNDASASDARNKPPTAPPARASAPNMSGAPNRPSAPGLPGVPPMRDKPPTDAPATRGKPPTDVPPVPAMRGKPPTDAPKPPLLPPRGKPPTDAPSTPARSKPPSIAPVRSIVPAPPAGPKGKHVVVPQHLRAGTEQGTPPPSTPVARPSQPGLSPPPSGSKTIAHAVPPMPSVDGESRRAQTDTDSSLDVGMRETDYITAVEIDHEAKAAAKAAAAAAAAAANDAADTDDEDDDGRVVKRADTDMRTGKNPLAGNAVGEVTAVGLMAAPPAPALRPGDDAEFNRAGSQSEHTAETQLPVMPPRENSQKTPIPTMERATQSPSPAERPPAQVPITTAPTSLPPPKKLDAVPSGPTPACPQCESPMAWVEEHLRFYCKNCRMYF